MNMGEWQRDANAPRLRVEDERGQCTASLMIARCWVMTLSAMTPTQMTASKIAGKPDIT